MEIPYLAGKYGGGAFLIPYIIMLVTFGIPLLIMEFAIGQKMQLGAVGAFGNIRHKLSSIGLGAVLCGFVVVSYYAVVMAWSLLYFLYSFTMKWGDNTKDFFYNKVLHVSDSIQTIGYIPVEILFALVIMWVLIYLERHTKYRQSHRYSITAASSIVFNIVDKRRYFAGRVSRDNILRKTEFRYITGL
jgi:neurotransmitter:Na+ symporter, NSS family